MLFLSTKLSYSMVIEIRNSYVGWNAQNSFKPFCFKRFKLQFTSGAICHLHRGFWEVSFQGFALVSSATSLLCHLVKFLLRSCCSPSHPVGCISMLGKVFVRTRSMLGISGMACVSMCLCVRTCVYLCMWVNVCICVYMFYVCVHICVWVCICVTCVCVCTCVQVYAHVCMCVSEHI